MSDQDIRAPDEYIQERLIDYTQFQETSDDEELNRVLFESIQIAENEFQQQIKNKKYEGQIESLKMIQEEELRLEQFKIQKIKEKQIEERELLLRPVIMFLNRLKLKKLLDILNIYIETGKKMDYQYFDIFKYSLKPSIFIIIEPLFDEEIKFDSDDDYEYEE
jgi:hypothetical protein